MSMTLFFQLEGKRQAIKVTPMRLLDEAVRDALGKLAPGSAADPAQYAVTQEAARGGRRGAARTVDGAQPIRFAGLQDRDVLTLVPAAEGAEVAAKAKAAARAKSRATQPRAAPDPAPAAATSSHAPEAPIDRTLIVFDQALLVATDAGPGAGAASDVPDDFYDLTPADIAALEASRRARNGGGGPVMLTQALRDRARRERAAAMGPVRIRVLFPHAGASADAKGTGLALQAVFRATETVDDLYAFVGTCVRAEPSVGGFCLFTTPPKAVLPRGTASTLFDAGLVPSANVHFGFPKATPPGGAGEAIRPEIVAAHRVDSAEAVRSHARAGGAGGGGVSEGSERQSERAGGAQRASDPRGANGRGDAKADEKGKRPKGMPKWFKM